MSGLWACVIGTGIFAVLLAVLEPLYRWTRFLLMSPQECPNQSGNSGAFNGSVWSLLIPFLALTWLCVVLIEQVLPSAWRGRHPVNYLVRALGAVLFTVAFGCMMPAGAILACH